MSKLSVKELKSDMDELIFSFKGTDVLPATINTLRRVIVSDIPCFGFNKRNIRYDYNTSHYDNDMMDLTIEMLPIYDVEHNVDLFDKVRFLQSYPDLLQKYEISLFDVKTGKDIKTKNDENYFKSVNKDIKTNAYDKSIELRLKIHNATDKIIDVTTHHCELYIEGVKKDNYKSHPSIIIVQLKPGQKISFVATAELGIGFYGAAWCCSTISHYNIIGENDMEFGFTTLGHLSKRSIMHKACNIIIKKLEIIKKFIEDNYSKEMTDDKMSLILHQENHTMGNLIAKYLQLHEDVTFAGHVKPHLLMEEIFINYASKKNPITTILNVLDKIRMIYMDILKQS